MQLLEMKDIKKAFSGVPVLKGVSLSLEEGEVHALLGENGAGKSTLMNILTGVITPDAGTIRFCGKLIEESNIRLTESLGIAFVHQELNLFPNLLVFENLFLCRELTNRFGKLNKKEMIARAQALFDRLGIQIDPTAPVYTLKTSQKQLLEISKALLFDAKLLILDEPTTALNNEEIDHLFGMLRALKAEGRSIIFISHKMPEIFAIADRYTVLRNGEFIAGGSITEVTPKTVTQMMVGGGKVFENIYTPRPLGETVLETKKLSGNGYHDVDIAVKKGEIVAFTGLQGSGSTEFLQGIFGVEPIRAGRLYVDGKEVTEAGIHAAMKRKVALLPSNRKENSVLPDLNILENMIISEHTLSERHQQISFKKERARYDEYYHSLHLKAENASDYITSLSGGNQQKIFIARWLNTQAEIFLLDNPTQGIDVGAKGEIYKLILEMAAQGKTIIVNTLEIKEIQEIADRCVIFFDGTIIKELPHDKIDEHTVMMYSTNAVNVSEDE